MWRGVEKRGLKTNGSDLKNNPLSIPMWCFFFKKLWEKKDSQDRMMDRNLLFLFFFYEIRTQEGSKVFAFSLPNCPMRPESWTLLPASLLLSFSVSPCLVLSLWEKLEREITLLLIFFNIHSGAPFFFPWDDHERDR